MQVDTDEAIWQTFQISDAKRNSVPQFSFKCLTVRRNLQRDRAWLVSWHRIHSDLTIHTATFVSSQTVGMSGNNNRRVRRETPLRTHLKVNIWIHWNKNPAVFRGRVTEKYDWCVFPFPPAFWKGQSSRKSRRTVVSYWLQTFWGMEEKTIPILNDSDKQIIFLHVIA